MPVASKTAAAKKVAGAKKTAGARSTAANDEAQPSTNTAVPSGPINNVDPVFVRDRSLQLALNLPYIDDDGNPNATAAKVVTQAKRFEDYLLGTADA